MLKFNEIICVNLKHRFGGFYVLFVLITYIFNKPYFIMCFESVVYPKDTG